MQTLTGEARVSGRSVGKIAVIALAVSIALAIVAWSVGGSVVVPMTFDARGLERIQLNGGTLTLATEGDARLHARVPLRVVPILMVRETKGLFEIGGVDDADLRVLLTPILSGGTVPATVDSVEWELGGVVPRQITVAGGTLRADGYAADELVIFGVAGVVDLQGLDIGTLAVHTQDPADATLAGYAGTFGSMDSGGKLDVSGLEYDNFDRGVIEAIITAP